MELRKLGRGRGPTLNTVSLAEAHLLTGELDQAVEAAGRAVRGAEESSSGRIRVCLTRLARRLEPHAKRPEVAETLHRIHVVTGAA